MEYQIVTTMEIKTKEELKNLRRVVESTTMEKPNFSKLGKELGIDRRTARKHYYEDEKKERKPRKSELDEFYELIRELLSEESKQVFSYKEHLYRYLQRERNLKCSRANFNYYILKHEEFANYFKPKGTKNAVKTETPFGKQAQFDWKEKLNFEFKTGEKIIINVGSLVLSASRFKVWMIYLSVSLDCVFDFLVRAFEVIGGVPEEVIIDNATTMMIKARTQKCEGTVNPKFEQFAKDYGFLIKPCIAGRPQTKAKVENPMRIIDEIMMYNGVLNNLDELYKKLETITNEANARPCQATGLPPIVVFKKEKEHFLPIPQERICSNYKIKTLKLTVNTSSLIKYKGLMYSAPTELIGKVVSVQAIEDILYVYYNKTLVTVHTIIKNKKINYLPMQHEDIFKQTFKNQDNIALYSEQHLKEMEQFCEQLSELM